MRNIKKAILAFVIFGFIGGCEAADVPLPSGIVALNDRPGSELRNANIGVSSIRTEGNVTITKNMNGIWRYQGGVQQGGALFSYVADKYTSIFNKFMYHKGNKKIGSEAIFCKNLVEFFLVLERDELSSKYGLNDDEIDIIHNDRFLYYWHIEKHFFDVSSRSSNGQINVRLAIDDKLLIGNGKIGRGNVTMEESHYNALKEILGEVIKYATFSFNTNQITAGISADKLAELKNTRLFRSAKVYEDTIVDGKIEKSTENLGIDAINGISFFFHLNCLVTYMHTLTDMRRGTVRDGDFGSFYLVL